MGGSSQVAADVGKPAADPARRKRPPGRRAGFPGTAQVSGERAGEQELGVRGHDQADPPVGLLGGADFGGQAEGALDEPEGVFVMQISSLGAQCSPVDNAA